jgi:ribonuclease P protein component
LKTRSLTKQSEFAKTYREGYKIVSRSLVLYFLPADDIARSVVASKKVGGAVQRNRAKRLLRTAMEHYFAEEGKVAHITQRAAISLNMQHDDGDQGLWVVAVARRAILELNIHELEIELSTMMSGLTR